MNEQPKLDDEQTLEIQTAEPDLNPQSAIHEPPAGDATSQQPPVETDEVEQPEEPASEPTTTEEAEAEAEADADADAEVEAVPIPDPKYANFKAGFAALIGRPNAGKSTLLNTLVGEHIAAVSSKPQTTRTRIRGIVNRPAGQIVFVDTPGIHKPGYALNRRMMGFVSDALLQVDVVLLMRDVTQSFGQGERFTLELVKEAKKPSFLLLNKIDLLKDKKALLPLIEDYRQAYDFAEIIPLSARTGDNQDLLVSKLLEHLPTGPPLYEPELFTDEMERTIAAEIVREKILEITGDEIPYVTAVRTEQWTEAEDATEIHCVIYVERASQKPILIGKQGHMLKTVGTRARRDIRKLLDRPVRLFLFVRVQEQWRNDPRLLDELGIEETKHSSPKL